MAKRDTSKPLSLQNLTKKAAHKAKVERIKEEFDGIRHLIGHLRSNDPDVKRNANRLQHAELLERNLKAAEKAFNDFLETL